MIKSASFARATQVFCRVGIAFILLALSPAVSLASDDCKADVVFLMDNTGSMGGVISSTRTNAINILDKIGGGDPRFAGIDVQFGVATFWGDPLEHHSGSIDHSGKWYCGPTPSYPTRGSASPVSASSWQAAYRCDKNTPDDPSDDFGSRCHGYAPEGSACTKPAPQMLSQMTSSQLTKHYADLRKAARRAYRVDQQLTDNQAAARTSMNAWRASGGGDWEEANYFALHQLATEGGQTDLYPSCGDSWWKGGYAVGDCVKDGADHYTANIAHRSDVDWAPTAHSSGSYVVASKETVQTIFVAKKDVSAGTSSPELNPTDWQALGDLQPRSNPTLWAIVSPRPLAETKATDLGYFTCGTGPDFSDYQGWSTDHETRKSSCTHAIGWRADAGRVIVTFGDAPSHISTVDATEVLRVLEDKNIVVASINTHGKNSGFDARGSSRISNRDKAAPYELTTTEGQSTAISRVTGGTSHHNISGSEATVKAILDAVAAGIGQAGSAAPVSFSANTLTEGTMVFVPKFDSKKWSGDLEGWKLNPATGAFATREWRAASQLSTRTPTSRNLLTYKGGNGVRFEWAQLSDAQQNDLRTQGDGTLGSVSDGQARLAYLRGDRSNEGAGKDFRVRASRMGDVWHSGPIYVGKPNISWLKRIEGGTPYTEYQRIYEARTGMVYVGSNGGMLHGFDAATGVEKMAYLPAALFSTAISKGYHVLTDPDYKHLSLYVDETPFLADARILNPAVNPLSAEWRTVLVGGLGRGGRGVYALDVTDPDELADKSKASQTVLWEFNSDDDANLGYTHSRPFVAYLNNGKWAAIFGNGIDDTGSGEAQLFIVYLDGPGADGIWDLGTDYRRISTNIGSSTERNGFFTPKAVDVDGNGTTDLVYAGDLYGNLWRFDLSGPNATDWEPPVAPLFLGSKTRPITSEPLIVSPPTSVTDIVGDGGRMIFFGTGRFLVDGDKTDINEQHYYGLYDQTTPKYPVPSSALIEITDVTLTDLAKQTFISSVAAGGRVTDPDLVVNYTSETTSTLTNKFGWYIDFPSTGERVIARSAPRKGHVLFNTIIPDRSACSSSGDGNEWTVRMYNGGSALTPQFDFNGDGRIDAADGVVVGGRTVGYAARKLEGKGLLTGPSVIGNVRFAPSSGAKKTVDMRTTALLGSSAESGRLSWGQLAPREDTEPTPPGDPTPGPAPTIGPTVTLCPPTCG